MTLWPNSYGWPLWRGNTVETAAAAVGEVVGLDERRVRDRWYGMSKPMRREALLAAGSVENSQNGQIHSGSVRD